MDPCSSSSEVSKLTLFCCVQVAAVREGMSTIIPVPLLSLLTAQQLEQLVCGLPEVSVEMLKKLVRYRDITESHQLIGWFWQSLEEFTNEERVLFLRFVSGRSRLPSNPADITQKFQIIKVDRVRSLLIKSLKSTHEQIWKVQTNKLSFFFLSPLIISSPSTASLQLRPASSCSACLHTQARLSSPSVCVTPSTTAPPSTWTTTCWPITPTQRTALTPRTETSQLWPTGWWMYLLRCHAHYALNTDFYSPNLYGSVLFICWSMDLICVVLIFKLCKVV